MKTYLRGCSAILACGLLLTAAAYSRAWGATPEQADVTATIDGAAWRAERALGTTLSIAGKPQLNFAATRQSGGIQVFTATLPLLRAGAYEGSFVFAKGALPGTSPTANFSVPARSDDLMEKSFQLLGSLVIEHYDAAAKTISGHFNVAGETHGHGARITIADGKFTGVPIDSTPP
jgi:hypothetical protein